MKQLYITIAFFFVFVGHAQSPDAQMRQNENQRLLAQAQSAYNNGDFATAEAAWRSLIARDPNHGEARYNLANAYYKLGKTREAGRRLAQAAEVAQTKEQKHKIYHNLGNVFMNKKQYRPAVEAYKNALRNNPRDEETRYNLALAKRMLEEHGDDSGGDDDEDQENQEQDPSDEGEDQDENQDEQDEQDAQEGGDEGDQEQDQPDQGEDQENDQDQQPQQREGRLSPEQVQSLLEAMNNQERKVQEKINDQNQQGARVQPEKDW